MLSSAAPYLVTIFVSMMSWTLSTYFSDINSAAYLRYDLVDDKRNSTEPYVGYKFSNLSPRRAISDIEISFVCSDQSACFQARAVTANDYAQLIKVPPWNMATAPSGFSGSIDQKVNLPPNMEFILRMSLASGKSEPILVFSDNSPGVDPIVIVQGNNLDLFIVRNYIFIIGSFWAIGAIVLLLIYRNQKQKPEETKPQIIHVKLIEE